MTQRKKILHLITGLEVGGAEMMLLKTLPLLQSEFDNHVCCIRGHGPIGARLEAAGVPVSYLELRSPFDFGVILRFRKIVREFQPEILVTYLIHADLFGRIFGRLFGIRKIICSQRGKLLQWEFLRILDRWTASLVTKYIVQTEVAKKELSKVLRVSTKKFQVIPNAIDLTEFDFYLDEKQKKTTLDIPDNHTVITCVSNLRRGKGHEYLLQAFERIFQTHRDLTLLIVGNGERMNELIDLVSSYASKENIKFLGNRTDVKDILRISDIFVLPTLGEGMSNAIMEAMASGIPIVTTDIPENRELIENNVSGVLVFPKDSENLAITLKTMANDPLLRKRLGVAARRVLEEKFSLPIITEKLSGLFHAL